MNKRVQGFILGAVSASVLVCGAAYATVGTKQIEVEYDNIKVYKDNVLCELKDANGSVIEPFIYNGTTYMPVRGTANLADMEVTWDGNTKSVYLWDEISNPDGMYLMEVCPPYEGKVYWTYTSDNSDTITMAGKKYTNAFALGCDYSLFGGGDGYALFNLNSRYKTLSFDVGKIDEYEMQDVTLNIYLDGRLKDSYELSAEAISKHITVDLNNALQLKLEITGGSRVKYGFVNAIIK